MALGDALGATTEFMTPSEIRNTYGVHRKIIGGGWLHLKPGRVTDDTEMALCVARALVAGGEWDLKAIADNFVAWMRGKPIDIGSTCRKGIREYMLKGQLETPYNDCDAGNGALMRLLPTALFTLGDDELLQRCAVEQAHLTHHHPLSDAACLCVGRMIHAALSGADRFALHAITQELCARYPVFRFNDYRGHAGGYVVETLQTVCHFFFATATFEECLIGVVNQGGDADTTGAIAGALAGAFYGPQGLPDRWLKKISPELCQEIGAASEQLLELSPWARKSPTTREIRS